MGQGLLLSAIGLAVGLTLAFVLSRVLSNLLYEVSSNDPLNYVGVSFLVVGVAIAASFLPAFRATRVDPVTALRYE